MKVRTIKKQNNNKIEKILKALKPLCVYNVKLGDGYFIFTFEANSICHFKLKELPHWTFAIWLGGNGYSIFGQITNLIDKFKPSCSELISEDVAEFQQKVVDLIANGGFLNADEKKYYYEDLETRKQAQVWNLKYYRHITDFTQSFNLQNKNRYLELKDLGKNCSPRYWVELFHAIEDKIPEEEVEKIRKEVQTVCDFEKEVRANFCIYSETANIGRW